MITDSATRLVSSSTAELPGTSGPCRFDSGSLLSLHRGRKPDNPPLPRTPASTTSHGSSATDAAKPTPPSVCPPPAEALSTVPFVPAAVTPSDADLLTFTDTAHYSAASVSNTKPTAAAFPNALITCVHDRVSAAGQWLRWTH